MYRIPKVGNRLHGVGNIIKKQGMFTEIKIRHFKCVD